MWFKRDFHEKIGSLRALPVKVLKGPRQVGKTSLLERLGTHKIIYLDDFNTRRLAQGDPRLFLDQFKTPIVLDEASLVPDLFTEIKRRVDEQRRNKSSAVKIDIWVTGSNQTLLQRNVQESLAGRANYFDLNTLSLHELECTSLENYIMRGGWPELHISADIDPILYLNDLISTFIEKDIVAAAGIEKKSAFNQVLQLTAGRVGQLFNASDIAKVVSVDVTSVQSWCSILEQNGILRKLKPYATNLNQRLIKAPKYYFEDVGLATRLQGWTSFQPLLVSPAIGNLIENLALGEIVRYFLNNCYSPQIFYLRSKEKVEIDFLIQLSNQRFIAAEVKMTPHDYTAEQIKLLDSLKLNIIERWVLAPNPQMNFRNSRVIAFCDIWSELSQIE